MEETPSIGGPKVNGKMVNKSWYRFVPEYENFDTIFDTFEADFEASDNSFTNANYDKVDAVFAPEADQSVALTHLRVGYFKWIHRYLGECNSEANHDAHSFKLNKISNRLKTIFETLTAAQA